MPKPPAAERPRLTLEDYILFFATHSGSGLTIDLLNQVRTQTPFNPISPRRMSAAVLILNPSCSRRVADTLHARLQ
jgi:hypothetical protein